MKIALPLLLFGYTLVYAAVAAGGIFADNPWRGFTDDAYDIAQQTTSPTQGAAWWQKVLHDLFGIVPGGGIALNLGEKLIGAIF